MFEFEVVRKANEQPTPASKSENGFSFEVVKKSSAAENRQNAKKAQKQQANPFGIQDVNQDGKANVKDVLREKRKAKEKEDLTILFNTPKEEIEFNVRRNQGTAYTTIDGKEITWDGLLARKNAEAEINDFMHTGLVKSATRKIESGTRLTPHEISAIKKQVAYNYSVQEQNNEFYEQQIKSGEKSALGMLLPDVDVDAAIKKLDNGETLTMSEKLLLTENGGNNYIQKHSDTARSGSDYTALNFLSEDNPVNAELKSKSFDAVKKQASGEALSTEEQSAINSYEDRRTVQRAIIDSKAILSGDSKANAENFSFLQAIEEYNDAIYKEGAERALARMDLYVKTGITQYANDVGRTGEIVKCLLSGEKPSSAFENEAQSSYDIASNAVTTYFERNGLQAQKVVQEVVTNVANNTIPLILGTVAGPGAYYTSFALSTFGGAMKEADELAPNVSEWNKFAYAVMQTVSEVCLEKAFSYVSGTGIKGDFSKKLAQEMTKNISSTIAKVPVMLFTSGTGEFLEEFSQGILSPIMQRIILGADVAAIYSPSSKASNADNAFAEMRGAFDDAAHSGMIGFFSGVWMSGPGAFGEAKNITQLQTIGKYYNKVFADTGTDVKNIATYLKEISEGKKSELYKAAEAVYKGDTSDVAVAEMMRLGMEQNKKSERFVFTEVGKNLLAQNRHAIDQIVRKYTALTQDGYVFPDNVEVLYRQLLDSQSPLSTSEYDVNYIVGKLSLSLDAYAPRAEIMKQLTAMVYANESGTDQSNNLQSSATGTAAEVSGSFIDGQGAVDGENLENTENLQPQTVPADSEIASAERFYDDDSGDMRFDDDFEFSTPETKDISRPPQGEELFEGMTGEIKTGAQRHILDMAKKLDSSLNIEFVEGLSTKGKFLRKSNRLLIRADLSTPQMYVELFKHEFMHRLETKKLYTAYMRYCFNKSIAFEQYARSSYFAAKGEVYEGDAEGVIKELTTIYYDAYKTDTNIPYSERKDFTYEDAQKEIIADFFGEVLFQGKAYRESIAAALEEGAILPQGDFETSVDALTELAQKERTLFEKIVDTIKEWINALKSEWRNRSVAQDLEYLEKRLEWVYQSADDKKALRKAQGDIKNAINVVNVTESDIQQNLIDISKMESVSNLTGNEFSKGEKDLVTQVDEYFADFEYSVVNSILGDVDITARGAKDSIAHGIGRNKAIAFAAIPKVIKHGKIIDYQTNWKNRGYDTVALAAPITINKIPYYVGVIVIRDNKTQRFYVHEVITEKRTDVPFKTGTNNKIGNSGGTSSPSIISLLDKIRDVKENLTIQEVDNNESMQNEAKYTELDETGPNSLGSPMQQLRYNPERYAKWLTRRFAAKIDVADIIPKLKRIVVESNKNTTELSENSEGDVGTAPTSRRLIRELAQEISQTVKPPLTPDAQERLSDIRHTAIRIDEVQRAEIEAEFGNITNFRRQTGLKISNDGISLDSRWQELSGTYPELFDADINPADMPTRIAEIVENLSENTEPIDYDAIAQAVAEQIQNTLDTTGPKAEQRKLEAARKEGRLQEQERARRKVRHLVGNAQNVEGELAAEYKAVAQKAIEEERKRAEKSLNRESNRKAIQRNLQHLDHLLRSNTNARHIPEKLKPVIKQLCKMFLDNSATVYQAKELADIRAYYSDYIVSENMSDSIPSQDIAAMLEILEEELTGRSLANVGNEELEAIRVVTDYFNRIVNEENDAFVNGKKVEVEELGKQAVDAVNNKKTLKVLKALRTPAAESMREFFYEGNLTPYYLFKRLGGVFQNLFNDLVEGQSRAAKNMDIAHNEIDSIKKRRNYSKWKNDTFDFVTERGVKLHLTVEQIMQIYATYQRQRNNKVQKAKHLLGGIVLDQKAINEARKSQGKTENGMDALRAKAIKLTEIDLIKLSGLLSEEQIGYADDVVALMSNWCAALGNDVTMQLYGYRKYTERYYIPYVSASEFLEFNVLKGEQRLMKSPSFSKQLQKKANNPLLIQGFSEVAANHIDTMCGYNGTAVAIDTLNKVLNHNNLFEIDVTDGSAESAESVWALIESNYGKGMVNVLKNFIADVNNGVTADKKYTIPNKMLRTFRKTAVMANLSVAIQQPTAIVKATLLMNPKYLVRAKVKNKKAEWAECCLYAPIASLKQHGQFHGEGGTHNTEWILGDDLDNTGEKIKDLFSRDSKTRDDALGVLAEKGDQVTWRHLWAAVKLEIADTTNLEEGSEGFLTACGERFTDIIIQTQVYDSVLSRSQNMRDKGVIGSMTSFMMEPTIAINIAADSVISYMENPTSANGKKLARTVLVLSATELAVAIFKSLITAMRDDDEDETYLEKYVEAVVTNYLSGMNFASKIPLVSDVFSLLEGYTVERPDMQIIADCYSAFNGLMSNEKTFEEKVVNLVGALGNLFGLPIKNVYRDISSLVRTITDFTDFEMPSAEKIKNSASTGAMEGMPLFKKISEFVEYGLTSIEKSRYMQSVKDNTTYKSLTDSERQKVSVEVIGFENDKESFEKSGLKSQKFEDLYEIRRKNGSSSTAYRNARKKLLKSGISEDDLTIGLEIAKMKYVEANGITVAEYFAAKAAMNKENAEGEKIYDADNSDRLSESEEQKAIEDMDGFTSKEKKIFAEVF